MASRRRLTATFDRVVCCEAADRVGLELGFQARRAGPAGDGRIEDFADLGPELTVPAVAGLGKLLRILRAARIAAPADPTLLLGAPEAARRLVSRALGTELVLQVRPRSRLRFTAWTESGVETVDHVSEVIEGDDAYLVMRRGGRHPVRLEREKVVRQRTEIDRWLEVVGVERP